MKIQPNYVYNNDLKINFKDRIRMHSNCSRPNPVRNHSNPNILVYLYEDSKDDVDIFDRTYDSFTGLRDKQYLLSVLNKRIEKSKMTGESLSVAMFDMDNFKSINELLGYEIGDDFIRFIADSIDKVSKENAINAYRFGGEEFVIIFQNQSESAQKAIVDKVLQSINLNSYVKSKEQEYKANAEAKLLEYSASTAKITALMNLKTKKDIYDDLRKNCASEASRNDEYLLKCIRETDEELDSMYIHLISDSIANEENRGLKNFLVDLSSHYYSQTPVSESDKKKLDEYLRFRYDKSAELFQIKKWLKDFKQNNGFSITGSDVTFKPEFLKTKTPMELIGIAGESLKKGKESGKGHGYYSIN